MRLHLAIMSSDLSLEEPFLQDRLVLAALVVAAEGQKSLPRDGIVFLSTLEAL